MANLHASLDSTCKGRISQISTRCHIWGVITQLLILNSKMNLNIFPILEGPFQNFWSWTQTTYDPEVRYECKNFSNPVGVHLTTWSWTEKWIKKFFQSGWVHPTAYNFLSWTQKWNKKIFQSWGDTCPQTHIHHTDFISCTPLGCVWLIKSHIHAICEKHSDPETCSSPKYRNGGKKFYNMPKCIPIDTKQVNPTKIIDYIKY